MEKMVQDLYEALEELRKQSLETLKLIESYPEGASDIEQALSDVLDGELRKKMKLVKDCADAVNNEIIRREERSQNRRDGYGSVR